MLCQDLPSKYIFVYGETTGPQFAYDPGSVAIVVLIAVFAAALAFGLLFLLGTEKHTSGSGKAKEPTGGAPPPAHGSQAGGAVLASNTMGDGIGRVFMWMDMAVNLLFSGLISLYKWAFNYNIRPSEPAATTVVSEEPRTRVVVPPQPEPLGQSSPHVPPATQPRPTPPIPAVTRTLAIFTPPMLPTVQPPIPASVLMQNVLAVPAPSPSTPAAEAPRAPAEMPVPRPPATPSPSTHYQQPAPPPPTQIQPTDRPHGLLAIIDIMGEGIEIAFAGMNDGIIFIFDGFINLFKWIFRIDR